MYIYIYISPLSSTLPKNIWYILDNIFLRERKTGWESQYERYRERE